MRDRGKRKLIMYGLMVALMVTTVAYAVLQTTLNINGTVTKKGGSWDIHFANLSTPSLTGDASSTNASIQATSFTFSATVEKPKDSIVYTFDVVNGGSIDATLDSITLSGATEAKAQDITYTLTYADGKAINKGDKLVSGQTRSLKLTVSYDDVDALSANGATLNLGATLIYVQTDGDGSGSLVPETPVLTSVTLYDLRDAGKITAYYPSGLGEMSLSPVTYGVDGCEKDFEPCSNGATITLNSYAKLSGTVMFGDPDFEGMTITYTDGSIHKIEYGYDVEVPVVTMEGFPPEIEEWEGNIYYIDDVPQYVLEKDAFVIEGDIATIEIGVYLNPLTFTEILIEE